jgi:hypothetical protein
MTLVLIVREGASEAIPTMLYLGLF